VERFHAIVVGAGHNGLVAMVAQQHGFPVVEGGAQGLSDALVRRLNSRGGALRCHTIIDRVVAHGGHAVGVVTANGQPLRATRAVLADVPAPTLYRDLVGLPACLHSSRPISSVHLGQRDDQSGLGPVRAGAIERPDGQPSRNSPHWSRHERPR
jgi:phytoene dehydrogenase-like protein